MNGLSWGLIVALAAINLVRPIMSTSGAFEGTQPLSQIAATVIIAAIQIYAVVARREPRPVATLAAAGGLYGVLIIVFRAMIGLFFPDKNPPPVPLAGVVAPIITNAIFGAALGFAASFLYSARRLGR